MKTNRNERIPKSIAASGGVWRLREDLNAIQELPQSDAPLDATRSAESPSANPKPILYEFDNSGALGAATGRISARINPSRYDAVKRELETQGYRVRLIHPGDSNVAIIEHPEALKPLKNIRYFSLLEGIDNLSPEILRQRSSRGA